MKYQLPENHALSNKIIENLVFKDGETFTLTDVQYEALDAGVGRSESLLVVSPIPTIGAIFGNRSASDTQFFNFCPL